MDMEIKATPDADSREIEKGGWVYFLEGQSDLESLENKEKLAATQNTHIEVISDASSYRSDISRIHFESSSHSESMESGESMETKETLAAAEQTKIKETSDADALWIKGTSAAAEQTEIEVTSDADAVRNERTSAAAEHQVVSALYNYVFDVPFLQSPQIEGTSAAAEQTEIEVISDADALRIEGTSAIAEQTEIEVISDADALRIEGTSTAAEHTERVERTQWPTNSIFHAPAHIKYYHRRVFEPKLVSIGPYYHGKAHLQQMERLKRTCIPGIQMKQKIDVRERNHPGPSEAGIPLCRRSIYNVPDKSSWKGEINIPLHKFKDSGSDARAFYKEEFHHSDAEFVRMLVIDSCFIIRTILSLSKLVQESMDFLDVNIKDIRSDLLILENQIPLFFIKKVYDWLFPVTPNQSFPRFYAVLEQFICLDMPWKIDPSVMKFSEEAAHLLDLYWRCSLSVPMYRKLWDADSAERERDPSWAEIHLSNNASEVIANAAELNKMAGIEFKNFNGTGFHFNFSEGIIWMPRLKIDTRQKNLQINLIAFENCILPSMRIFSCYMKLMDALIDSANDVMLLQNCGVIYNTLESHEMAAAFFNDIGNFCFIDRNTNHYSGFCKDVKKYYDSNYHRRLANLCQNYFSSPWAGISLLAAGFLLILSVVQTFYALYGYYKPMN